MLDIRLIKENPDFVKERLASRQKDYSADIDRVLQCDAERRALISDTESKRAAQNAVSKKIPQMKKAGEDTTAIMAEMKALAEAEIENARRTIPLVELDSRLGYEPSMEYIGDKEHLLWKIEKTKEALEKEILPLLYR